MAEGRETEKNTDRNHMVKGYTDGSGNGNGEGMGCGSEMYSKNREVTC